jgi:hypothetical protein
MGLFDKFRRKSRPVLGVAEIRKRVQSLQTGPGAGTASLTDLFSMFREDDLAAYAITPLEARGDPSPDGTKKLRSDLVD